MQPGFRLIPAALAAGLGFVALYPHLSGQEPPAQNTAAEMGELPEAPQPQMVSPADGSSGSRAQPADAQNPAPSPSTPSPASGAQSSSSASGQPPQDEKSQHEKAEEQLRQQEKQRVMGVMAAFNTTQNRDAAPLSSGQKFKLFFRSATDPWPFLLSGVVAGIGQAENSNPEWGQGAQGYAKRFGAGYSDYFIGNFFGNAVLTSLLKEDPRYFQKGTGSPLKRFFWAAGSTIWCKRDNGTWGPNYANVGGNMIGAAIGRVYYPSSGRTVGDTLTDGLTVSAEGVVGAEVIEFWPDMVRAHQRKKAEKQARAQAEADRKAAGASQKPADGKQ
jgi:hypothetical protein